MREKGARHLPSGIAAALGIMRPNPVIEAGSSSKKRRLSKVITLEDGENEDEDEEKMRISTCRHIEVFMCQIRQFHVSDQIKIRSIKAESEKSRSDQIRSDGDLI
ncbi:BZ3500_MvSof-1268-A1-R1_Chr1-3g01566 [Microbotryum saponariae]|uniref:BZ3500_MvSof-1268-A1-R1_Chr1-3g01566 protein n=1 Tax=Microbotryum saponariae TaxID=289078 RepID=A0A2X0KPR9_9BASI|nr:BZ3500_MvSof-1268-A1-R1_Chr1-3g01566 [Microbotryum saponariae]SCZ94048.1 BZ3501_MvSof-1269-A2-R1_Chr1-3g01168 [Microbotryum saponariae]